MGIEIKLSAPAVRELIKNDDTFRLELQRAVIAEISREQFTHSSKEVVTDIVKELMGEHTEELVKAIKEDEAIRTYVRDYTKSLTRSVRDGTTGWRNQSLLTQEIKDAVAREVRAAWTDLIREQIDTQRRHLDDHIQSRMAKMDQRIAERLDKLTPEDMAQKVAEAAEKKARERILNELKGA